MSASPRWMTRRPVRVMPALGTVLALLVGIPAYRDLPAPAGPVRPYPQRSVDGDLAGPLIFISDTQAPLRLETLRLEEHGNVKAAGVLFSTIAALPVVLAVFHLGDITAVGSSGREWRAIDRRIDKPRAAGIPFFPVLGNHDYMWWSSRALENDYARFAYARPSWYLVRAGRVAVVLLNSNFDRLGQALRRRWRGRRSLASLTRGPRAPPA